MVAVAKTYSGDERNVAVDTFPRIFHHVWFTWYNTTMPSHYAAYRESCRKIHPSYKFRLWTDGENRDFLLAHYPWFVPYYDSYDQPVKMSDAIRYFLLYHYGGTYLDLDVLCLKNLDSLLDAERRGTSTLLGRLGERYRDRRDRRDIKNHVQIL